MKRNHTWVHSTVGVAAMAVCLTASSALAQMSESMPGGGNNSSMGQMHAPGQQPGQQPGNNMPGQQPGNMSTQQNNANTMMDQSFLRSVMQNAQIETDLSQLALKNSSNDNVKELAQQVIRDHEKLASEVSGAASSRNVALPERIPGHVRKEEKKLQSLSGSAFDQAYLQELDRYVKDDQNRVGMERASGSVDSMDLSQLAMELHNMAQSHSQQIDQVAKAGNLTLK